jgi:long-chain acyl-CoA synthetase
VAGVPDQTTGEAVKAYVVLKDGQAADKDEIISFARENLIGYRAPKLVEFRESLPETMVGKVLRRKLQEEERSKAGAGS